MGLKPRHLIGLIGVAILLTLVALLLIRPGVVAPTIPAVNASQTPAADREPIPEADPVPWTAVEWQAPAEPLAADPPLIRLDGIVDGGAVVLGWGRASTPDRNQFNDMGAVVASEDGRSWRTVLVDHGVEPPNTSELNGIAVGPGGYLAYGGVCCEPESRAVWHSTDGTRWERLPILGEFDPRGVYFSAVVGTETGWVAAGNGLDGNQGQIWFSSDGSTWEGVDIEQPDVASATISDLAVGPQGLIAIGTLEGADGTFDGWIWTSPDGRSWKRVGVDDPVLAGPGETQLNSVVAHAGGLFITGMFGSTEERQRCEELGMASIELSPPRTVFSCATGTEHHWISADGDTWERIDPMDVADEHPIEFRVVTAGGPGLVVLGESSPVDSPDTNLFASADGRQWTAIGPGEPMGDGVAIGIVVRGRSLLAVTDQFDGITSSTRFWVGSAE